MEIFEICVCPFFQIIIIFTSMCTCNVYSRITWPPDIFTVHNVYWASGEIKNNIQSVSLDENINTVINETK